jgi:TonB-dependent receptor
VDELPPVTDTTATNSYGRWFPMVHLRIRPLSWFDARIAFTRSQVHPRLSWMLPKREIHESKMEVSFGNPELEPQTATNIDLFLSFYGNRVGLLTLGGFYKEIEDLIFNREGHKILNAEKEGFSPNLQGFFLDRPENNPHMTYVKGFEIEWQTNFSWLPEPFNGLVLNANYTHLWSSTHYPRSFVLKEKLPVYPYVRSTVIDTFRTGAMLDQADDIANLSIGYDKGPVSVRASMLFQGKTLSGIGERPEQDSFTADLLRWDLSAKIRLMSKLDFFFNFNNITNEPDESYRLDAAFPTQSEYYSWTGDIGIGYRF